MMCSQNTGKSTKFRRYSMNNFSSHFFSIIIIVLFVIFEGCSSSSSSAPGHFVNPLPGTTYRFATYVEDSLGFKAADYVGDTAVTQLVALNRTVLGKYGCTEFLESYQSSFNFGGWGTHYIYRYPSGDISIFSASPYNYYFSDSTIGFIRLPSISPSPIILKIIDTIIYYQGDNYHVVLDLRTESAGTTSMVIAGKLIFCYRYQLKETGTATKISDGTTIPGAFPNGALAELWYAPELAYFTKRIDANNEYFQSIDGKIYRNKVLEMTSYNINE